MDFQYYCIIQYVQYRLELQDNDSKYKEVCLYLTGQVMPKTKPGPGVVILHELPRGFKVPSISPFTLKLETYIRAAKIPYEVDNAKPFGPKGKSPWISLDGTDVCDTTFIIQFLNQRFDVNLNKDLDESTRSTHWALQIMIEDHLFWIFTLLRFSKFENLRSIQPLKKWFVAVFHIMSKRVVKRSKAHGMGLHSPEERRQLAQKDIQTLAQILDDKPFFGGENPAEIDCTVFGFLAQIIFAPGTDYDDLFTTPETKKLADHCHRMKEHIWPDWENCLHKGQ